MADISKITSPIVPHENIGAKNKPTTEQLFEINNPSRVNKPDQDKQVTDRDAGGHLRDLLNSSIMQPVLRETSDLAQGLYRMMTLLQLGISTTDVLQDPTVQKLLKQIFVTPEELLSALEQQDESFVIFKGSQFDVLRDILAKFENNPRIRDALVQLLKSFEYNVNTKNSIKSILYNCDNLLDYMFSKDREQFGSYLDGLADMLLPEDAVPQNVPLLAENGQPVLDADGNPVMQPGQAPAQLETEEAAQVLKNNLLPLLGEIVVKYHQNGHIRDMVMVVVHNIVRVDKGTPEALREAVENLVLELKKAANLPEKFEANLMRAMQSGITHAQSAHNEIMERLADAISETLLGSSRSTPAAIRQAENLLLSLLQNQSSMMDVLHFLLPLQTPEEMLTAELYVDPDSDEGGKPGEKSRKLFLSVQSENHGPIEMSFLQTGDRVSFTMWCSEKLVEPLFGLRRTIANIMQVHGYTMVGFEVDELVRAKTIADVFPKLLNRKVGIDVRI